MLIAMNIDQKEKYLQSALSEGEQILWSAGADEQSRLRQRDQIVSFFIIMETVSLAGILIFGMKSAHGQSLVLIAWAMAAAAIVASVILYKSLGKLGNEIYALTQKRVLALSAKNGTVLNYLYLENLGSAIRRDRRDGTVDLIFEAKQKQERENALVFRFMKESDFNNGFEAELEKRCSVKVKNLQAAGEKNKLIS